MTEKLLSQEEIDALLTIGSDDKPPHLEDMEIDALGEIGNIAMGTAATALSLLLGQEVKITTPKVGITTEDDLKRKYPHPYVLLEVSYSHGLQGTNFLIVQEQDALLISELMMGGSSVPEDVTHLDEIRLSAVGEAMNQMMGSSATAISTVFNTRINISPPSVFYKNLSEIDLDLGSGSQIDLVQISFDMTIGSLVDSQIMQILPLDFARELVGTLMGSLEGEQDSPDLGAGPPEQIAEMPPVGPTSMAGAAPESRSLPKTTTVARDDKVVQPVVFAPLVDEKLPASVSNLDLLLDIPLEVVVELGRTNKLIKDILELGVGSVIELDKLAGEPVDVVVNGKLIARGEVVVIDENFGVRITDIIAPADRIKQLQ